MAHHLHAPAQLIRAARRGIPALVLIRDPEDTILSQVQWEPDISMRAALMTYVRFYRAIEPYAGGLVTATFPQVTEDFGGVIRRLNARFGTNFDVYEPTEEHQRLCFELMQERASEVPEWRTHVLRFESGEISLTELLEARPHFPSAPDAGSDDTWGPSSSRRRTKEALRRAWNEASLRDLRDRCHRPLSRIRLDRRASASLGAGFKHAQAGSHGGIVSAKDTFSHVRRSSARWTRAMYAIAVAVRQAPANHDPTHPQTSPRR